MTVSSQFIYLLFLLSFLLSFFSLTKQETLLGRGSWVENSKVSEPRRTALCISFLLILYVLFLLDALARTSNTVFNRVVITGTFASSLISGDAFSHLLQSMRFAVV